MKKILSFILSFFIIFSLVPLSVFASDVSNQNEGTHHNDDDSEDGIDWWYELFAKNGYLVMNDDYFINYLIDNWYYGPIGVILDSHDSSKVKLGNARNVFKENPEMLQELNNNITVYVDSNIGYYTMPVFNFDYLTGAYFATAEAENFVRGGASQSLLSYVMVRQNNNSDMARFNRYSYELKDYNFVYNGSFSQSSLDSLYRSFVSIQNVNNRNSNIWLYDEHANRKTFTFVMLNGTVTTTYNTLTDMGRYSANYGSWLVYTNDNYAFVPLFKNTVALNDFLLGNSSLYVVDTLKNIDFDKLTIDYKELQNSVSLAIQNGDFVSSLELNAIIQNSVTDYLKNINVNTQLLLLVTQRGLINSDTNDPYLKEISLKIDEIIALLPSGSTGGVNIDLTNIENSLDTIISNQNATNEKLDEILAHIKVNIPNTNIPSPPIPDVDIEVDDLLNQLKDTLLAKFPFSIVNDVQLITLLFKAEPVKPDLKINIQLPFIEDSSEWYIDLTWFDSFRDYWLAFCSIAFLIFLLTLSIKIINALKE